MSQSFHHRSFLRSINIFVKESQCYQLFTKVPQLATHSFFSAPFADGDLTCTRSFNKFKSFAGARNQDFMNTITPKTQKSTRPCVSLFASLNPASLKRPIFKAYTCIVIVNLYSASSGEAPQRHSRPNKTKP